MKGICKSCDKLLARQRYYKNKEDPNLYEQMKARDKERKRCLYQNVEYRERKKELARERYRRNVGNRKTKYTPYNSQKYLSNRDAIRAQQKKYYEQNREK